MNPQRIIAGILCFFLCGSAIAQPQDIDKELSDLAEKLAVSVKEHGNKKVTVVDFTDLDGKSTELGRYIAEQLTVNLVMGKRDFSVLDRANLKRILAEHKLTAEGLIDPENAKKLGMFAGVDAMILGNIIPKGTNISLTVKIITTETAEIVGAARAEFKVDETVQQYLSPPSAANGAPGQGRLTPGAPDKPFGDLQVKAESMKILPGAQPISTAILTLIITNTSDSVTYGVGINPDYRNKFNLSNSRGDTFLAYEVNGINTVYDHDDNRFYGTLSDVPPKSSIVIVSKSQVAWTGKPGEYRPYRLQTIVVFGAEENGRHPNLRKYNLVMDIN